MAALIEIVWLSGRVTHISESSFKTDFAPYDSVADMLQFRFDKMIEEKRLRVEIMRCEPKSKGDPKEFNPYEAYEDEEEGGPTECEPLNEYYADLVTPEEFDDVFSISYAGTPVAVRIDGVMLNLQKARVAMEETNATKEAWETIGHVKVMAEQKQLSAQQAAYAYDIPVRFLEDEQGGEW